MVNALAPAEVSKVVPTPTPSGSRSSSPTRCSDRDRRGSERARLASQLTGWDIDIVSDTDDRERRQREFRELTEMFMDALNVEEVIAQLLVTEGFASVQDVAYTATEELAGIEGFDEEIAEALKERAQAYLDEVEQTLRAEAAELGMAEDLLGDGLQLATIVELGRKGSRASRIWPTSPPTSWWSWSGCRARHRRGRCDHHGCARAAGLDRSARTESEDGRRRPGRGGAALTR